MDERKIHTLVEISHCLLQVKDLPTKFWVEAIYCSNYLLNLVSTHVVSSMTPIKSWCGKNPLFRHLRRSRCIAWEHIFYACRNKLDVKIHSYIMTGYYE